MKTNSYLQNGVVEVITTIACNNLSLNVKEKVSMIDADMKNEKIINRLYLLKRNKLSCSFNDEI